MRRAIIAACLLLGSCGDGLSEQQVGEAHDVATDAAHQVLNDPAAMAQHEARITQLEQRIARLEFCIAHPDAADCGTT